MESNFISHRNFVVLDKNLNNDELWYVAKNVQNGKFKNLKISNQDYKKLACESKLNYCEEYYGCEYDYSNLK